MSFLPTIIPTHISLYKGSHRAFPNFKEMGTCYDPSVPKGRDESHCCWRTAPILLSNLVQARNYDLFTIYHGPELCQDLSYVLTQKTLTKKLLVYYSISILQKPISKQKQKQKQICTPKLPPKKDRGNNSKIFIPSPLFFAHNRAAFECLYELLIN